MNKEQLPASAAIFALGCSLLASGCSKKNDSPSFAAPGVRPQFKEFVAEKEAQAIADSKAAGKELLPEYKSLFAAASKKDWPKVKAIFDGMARRAPQYSHGGTNDDRLVGTSWQTVLEIDCALEALAVGDEKYMTTFGSEIISSIPAGSIYFGGTDPGRGVVTALQKSHVNADPFFTVTQNALADGSYLEYVRKMYGSRIYIPTDDDSKSCFENYSADAARRQKLNQLKPGEKVKIVDGKPEVSGQVAVMTINGLLAKVIFDRNSDREFYIEQSFALDWMYPHLEPHGLIFKINREPTANLSDAVLEADRNYWTHFLGPILGDWLTADTTTQEIAAFVDKVHRQHDFHGFKGDPRFVQNNYTRGTFGKLRADIAGLYLWRMQHARDDDERTRMAREAEFALRQAWATCPNLPEAVFPYMNLLSGQNRTAEAVLVGETAAQQPGMLYGRGGELRTLIRKLKGQG
jgi:hypothetical protein